MSALRLATSLLLFGCANAPTREPSPRNAEVPSAAPLPSPAPDAAQSVTTPDRCSGNAIVLDELFARGGCETTDEPERVALRDPVDAHLQTSVEPSTWEAVSREVFIPGREGVRRFTVRFANTSSRAIALYFRFDPSCRAADWAGPTALGVQYRVTDAQGALLAANPRECAIVSGPKRTVRVSLDPAGVATLTTFWGPELMDRSDQLRPLKPGTYELRIMTPLVGVSDVGRERTFVRVPVVIPARGR